MESALDFNTPLLLWPQMGCLAIASYHLCFFVCVFCVCFFLQFLRIVLLQSSYYTNNYKQFYAKERKNDFTKQLDFNATSIKTQNRNVTDYKF